MQQRYFEINEKGHNIRCKLYYQDLRAIDRMVLFCHGFGGHKDNAAAERFAERMISKQKGAAVVTFNLPCHGDDVKKKLTLADCDTYLSLVLAHVQEKYQPDALYAYATSFGGYLTLKYLHDHGNPFRKIVLRCPAVNIYEALTDAIISKADQEKLQKGREVPVGFDRKIMVSGAFLEELRVHDLRQWEFFDHAEDILILHGTADEIVPMRESLEFADRNVIECIPVTGADHRFHDPKHMDLAIKYILDFFS